ncbi:hypothetical protein ES703_96844 [subsurface metagenome]
MGIVLGELPYPEKPMHNTAGFVSMHEAKLGDAHGKFTI